MTSAPTETRLLKTAEAARVLGLSASTLSKLRLTGSGPSFRKLGRAVRYAPLDLQAWADAHSRRSTSEGSEA